MEDVHWKSCWVWRLLVVVVVAASGSAVVVVGVVIVGCNPARHVRYQLRAHSYTNLPHHTHSQLAVWHVSV